MSLLDRNPVLRELLTTRPDSFLDATPTEALDRRTRTQRPRVAVEVGLANAISTLAIREDADLPIRLAAHGARFVHVPEVHTRSLRRGHSYSHDCRRNSRCRLHALEKCAAPLPAMRTMIGAQAAIAADGFVPLGSAGDARQALALCRKLGHPVPGTSDPLARGRAASAVPAQTSTPPAKPHVMPRCRPIPP